MIAKLFKIHEIERLKNSNNGNPKFKIKGEFVGGEYVDMITKTDGQIGYVIENYRPMINGTKNTHFIIEYHKTKANKYILDDIIEMENI